MNKKLLAMAVGAALVAGPALVAQAEVKLYGHAHMSLDNLDRSNSTDTGEWFVSDNASRFGIRASEDLGGGLKAVSQFEFLIGAGTSSSNETNSGFGFDRASGGLSTNRDNYVGLEGGFGRLALGQIDSATKDTGGIADMFYREQLGEGRAITNVGNMDGRVQSGVHYLSPGFGGLTFKAQYGVEDRFDPDATQAAVTGTKQLNAGVRWTGGPLTVGAAMLQQDNTPTSTLPSPASTKGQRAAAKFDVGGGFAVSALWQSVTDIGGVANADRDALGVGTSFKAGNNILKAQWYQIDKANNATTDNGADMLALGWDHLFSKTVKGYVTYAKTSNDTAGTFGIGGNGHGQSATPLAGQDATGYSIGVIVDF